MKKTTRIIACAAVLAVCAGMTACQTNPVSSGSTDSGGTEISVPDNPDFDRTSENVTVADFSRKEGIPLFKRQNTFSVSYSFGLGGDSSKFIKAAGDLQALRSENMRVDLSMGNGGLGKFLGLGTPGNLTYDFTALDLLMKVLYKNGTQPYFSYSFTPDGLKQEGVEGAFRYPPADYDEWENVCRTIAAHYQELGWPLAAHEIWNEPDLYDGITQENVFFMGEWAEYIKMYEYGVRGIRAANPDASVGGLSLAFIHTFAQTGKLEEFFEAVRDQQLPLDFISYHNYGTSGYLTYTDVANRYLAQYGDTFAATQLHINEFHVVDTQGITTEKANTYTVVPLMLQAIQRIIDMPQVTCVNWATWRDNGEGLNMVDNKTGKRFAPYHVLSVYNNMPIDRVALDTKGKADGFAAVDTDRAGVVLYSQSFSEKALTVALDNLPFPVCDIRVYAIDQQHSSFIDTGKSDELECIWSADGQSTVNLRYDGVIAPKGMLYIEITRHGAAEKKAPVWDMEGENPVNAGIATVARREYYFQDRTKNTFSEFDLGSFTAYAGMGNNDQGLGMGAAVLTNLPDKLTVQMETWGPMESQSDRSSVFLKVDYRGTDGKNLKSTVYTGALSAPPPTIPWSESPGEIRNMENDMITLDFRQEAPDGFSGDIILTYGIRDAGKGSTVKFRLCQ